MILRSEIDDARRRRAAAIHAAIRELGIPWAPQSGWTAVPDVRYALLEHTLYGLRRAATARDTERCRDALALLEQAPDACAALFHHGSASLLIVSASACRNDPDEHFDSTPYLLTPRALDVAPPIGRHFLQSGLTLLQSASFAKFVQPSAGVVVLLQERRTADACSSYSLSGIGGSVYTDWTKSPVRFAEALLHESAHCWLNESLAALGEDLPLSPLWHSPWKGTQRPAFGILHATFAFSVLKSFFVEASRAPNIDDFERGYCESRVLLESRNLQEAEKAAREAVELVGRLELKRILLQCLERALS